MGSFPETHHFTNGRLTSGSERGRGSLIPYSRTFFTTIPHPELLKSPSRIPLSFPIPQEFFRFPESSFVFRPNLGSRRKIPFQTLGLDVCGSVVYILCKRFKHLKRISIQGRDFLIVFQLRYLKTLSRMEHSMKSFVQFLDGLRLAARARICL